MGSLAPCVHKCAEQVTVSPNEQKCSQMCFQCHQSKGISTNPLKNGSSFSGGYVNVTIIMTGDFFESVLSRCGKNGGTQAFSAKKDLRLKNCSGNYI